MPSDVQVFVACLLSDDSWFVVGCVTYRDAGERLVGELAPELVPWLTGLQQPANFVPVTNEVLKEMARRGVSRDKLLTSLQLLGSELPGPTVRMLQWAANNKLPVKILSDCNR